MPCSCGPNCNCKGGKCAAGCQCDCCKKAGTKCKCIEANTCSCGANCETSCNCKEDCSCHVHDHATHAH